MTREFFVPEWLRAHPALYLVSHMVILPLILLYGSTVDWLTAGAAPPRGLIVFLAATYACGLVLELGRKAMEGAPSELRNDPSLRDAYLGRAEQRKTVAG